MPRRIALVLAALLFVPACAPHAPRVPFVADLDRFLAEHPIPPDRELSAEEIGRTASASYHIVQVRGRETPHRHATHDLSVVLLRGRGVLTRGDERIALAAGDAAVVPRGEPHWFANGGRGAAVALVAFAPPLDAPDSVPVR
ncbi:MAG TPA: cupin domain-containing protein [Candidatus Binatia bacterium]|nr:cupin domain-containing protein [Candidatus Binatia bacterium]